MPCFLFTLLAVLASSVSAADTNYLLRKPALSRSHIVFSFAGDLWSVSREGGDARRLTTGPGVETDPVFSPDGSHLAYAPVPQAQEAWKRYRGGQTKKIWIADLADSSVVGIPRENSNDFNPMWIGDRIYFLSDRNGPVSLFCYDPRTRQVKQLIENHGLDFKSAAAG